MTRRPWLRDASIVLLASSARMLDAQPVIGHVLECRDRPEALFTAGYLTRGNNASRSGFAGRAMLSLFCDPRGRDGMELGFFHVPYLERRDPSSSGITARGTGLNARYLGAVTERSLPGLLDNLHVVLGLGAYAGHTWDVREYEYPQRTRYDYGRAEAGLGVSFGGAFLFRGKSDATIHLDARQHLTPSAHFFVLSAGILF